MKKWKREWKLELIEKENPDWNDSWSRIFQMPGFPLSRE